MPQFKFIWLIAAALQLAACKPQSADTAAFSGSAGLAKIESQYYVDLDSSSSKAEQAKQKEAIQRLGQMSFQSLALQFASQKPMVFTIGGQTINLDAATIEQGRLELQRLAGMHGSVKAYWAATGIVPEPISAAEFKRQFHDLVAFNKQAKSQGLGSASLSLSDGTKICISTAGGMATTGGLVSTGLSVATLNPAFAPLTAPAAIFGWAVTGLSTVALSVCKMIDNNAAIAKGNDAERKQKAAAQAPQTPAATPARAGGT